MSEAKRLAKELARQCIEEANNIAFLSKNLDWQAIRKIAQWQTSLLAKAKSHVSEIYPMNSAHMKAIKALTELVVAIDIGYVVDPGDPQGNEGTPRPRIADRNRPCVVKLPDGFEGLWEAVEKEAQCQP